MNRRQFLLRTAATSLLVGSSTVSGLLSANLLPADPFFGLSFASLNDGEQSLAKYLGKPLVLNFWATWCAPCVEEMPDLEALSHEFSDVQFLGVAVDTKNNVHKFLERIPVNYDILVAGHGGVQHMRSLGNKKGGLPFTVLFNRDGRIAHRILGQIKPDDLRTKVQSII